MEVAGFTKTFSLDQGQILGNDQVFQALYNAPLSDGKRGGICCGLSLVWLARRMMFHDESAKQRAASLISTPGFQWSGKTQDIHNANPASGSSWGEYLETMLGEALRAYALRVVPSTISTAAHTDAGGDAAVMWAPARPAGSYVLHYIWLDNAGASCGHWTASYASHGTLGHNRHFYHFDPNMGEYRVGTGDGETYLKGWVQAYLDTFTGVRHVCSVELRRA
ncbi:hypothetical protein GXW78_20935 [Roseomonas terrae]|uniref:Peptidase C58 YopT-type domain-containing protein n=1 Tax=Neoroseomonas terrae TaxID=424799 RepID=A0ABS5EM81_9PROT|nr:hypothetical protein [Neoroseomonas terrae]MBR0652134.1 hypothetical protein [Neoroseomonas terrae]